MDGTPLYAMCFLIRHLVKDPKRNPNTPRKDKESSRKLGTRGTTLLGTRGTRPSEVFLVFVKVGSFLLLKSPFRVEKGV
jgi:hypothetical protein